MMTMRPLIELRQITMPRTRREATIQERFECFHQANPHVYAALRTLALEMRANGVAQYGIKGLFEILRWQFALQTQGATFRLSNNHTSRYARLLMAREPVLVGFFSLRGLRSE